MSRLPATIALLLAGSFAGAAAADATLTPEDARAIAKEAYIYGFPMVDSYRINHAYFVDAANPEFKASWNEIHNTARVYTPEDKAIQTPNSDTPYSQLGIDLRAEPIVLTVPAVESDRYFSVQLIDGYTFNFAYIGSRASGNAGGSFLVAGPDWEGETPAGISGVFRSGTDLAWALYRTQLFSPEDLAGVEAVQAGYRAEPLSAFLGTEPPSPAPAIDFIAPLSPEEQRSSLAFFDVLNFVLRFAPVDPSEVALRERFARLGIVPGAPFDEESFTPEVQAAIRQGMDDAWAEYAAFKAGEIDTGRTTSGDLFGTREFLQNNYLYRMAGAVLGIYGNSREEAMYPVYTADATGAPLDGSKGSYTLRFPPDALPPVNAFWSLTLYELPSSLLYANPLNRYLINSPMLPDLKRDADGGLTLHVSHASPGAELESNWLPAPDGPFWLILRLYWPKDEALDGSWRQPPLEARAIEAEAAPAGAGGNVVDPSTYIRAETDRSFHNIFGLSGAMNTFYHFRSPTPLDGQTVVRMNRDTLYSAAIVDTSEGATVTLPEVDPGRFISALIVDNDHYAPAVFYEPGVHEIPGDTRHVLVAVRIQLFDPEDPEEIARVNALQDQVVITAASADPLPPNAWDQVSLAALTRQYEAEAVAYGTYRGMMGPRGTVDEATRHLAAAAAWGLNPDKDAVYLSYAGGHDPEICHTATYAVPENGAFWSITVYGDDGYMKSDNNILNSTTVSLNEDGTFTAHYGSAETCGDVPNRLDVTTGWNFLMRVYRPGPSVLDGTYVLPEAQPVR
jgi:hypothetical protein